MSEAYLELFERRLVQSAASKAYHAQARTAPDESLWLSRLQPIRGLKEQLGVHGVTARGVLHVGGHYGLELEAYLTAGCERVWFFEPNPLVLEVLRAHVSFWQDWLEILGRPMELKIVEVAVSDQEGEADLHVAELEMLTSLHRASVDWIRVQDTVRVRTAPLDALVPEPDRFNVLNLDVQGHELHVLQGAVRTMTALDAVIVELAYGQRYVGEAAAAVVDARLREAGFSKAGEVKRDADVSDALYVRR